MSEETDVVKVLDGCSVGRSVAAASHLRRRRHMSGWYGDVVVVHGTYRPHPEGLVDSQYRYDRAPPWSVRGICIPHVRILMEQIRQVCKILLCNSRSRKVNKRKQVVSV